jgi:hypothetical protein
MKKTVPAAALGECVHEGILYFRIPLKMKKIIPTDIYQYICLKNNDERIKR